MTSDYTCMMPFYWGFKKLPVKQAHIDARNKLQIMDPEVGLHCLKSPALRRILIMRSICFLINKMAGKVVKLPYPKHAAA